MSYLVLFLSSLEALTKFSNIKLLGGSMLQNSNLGNPACKLCYLVYSLAVKGGSGYSCASPRACFTTSSLCRVFIERHSHITSSV